MEFAEICAGRNRLNEALRFELVFSAKSANDAGIQLADVVAHPIARHIIASDQPSGFYDVIEPLLRRSLEGTAGACGLKVFP